MTDGMQWLDPRDQRFDWLNVADWETIGDGMQPVRVGENLARPMAEKDRAPRHVVGGHGSAFSHGFQED